MKKPLFLLAHAFELGRSDAYIHFPHWNDDLEHRMMSDWIVGTHEDGLTWLDVREAAVQGWQERQDSLAADRPPVEEIVPNGEAEILRVRAHAFGAREIYQRFPIWSDDLEYKLQADWRRQFGGLSWIEVRQAVKEGWESRRAQQSAPAQL